MKNNMMPTYAQLTEATFRALKELGGSGRNDEINSRAILLLDLSSELLDIPHQENSSLSEINYRLAWARTLLKNYGAIENSARSVWTITPKYVTAESVDGKYIQKNFHKKTQALSTDDDISEEKMEDAGFEVPDEAKPWRKKLHNVLLEMDPYSFEKLAQRLLRYCGFDDVKVTKQSGDGGIDGTGKLKINGILSFNIAFQCKRYRGMVSAGEIRDFRGSLTTDIEKGVFITTGSFSNPAKLEASDPGKQRIDLMDGEEFMNKLAEYGIGVKEIKDYEVDEDFFRSL